MIAADHRSADALHRFRDLAVTGVVPDHHGQVHAFVGGGAQLGTVTAKSIGGVSVSLAVSASASGPNGSTAYGRAFDALMDRVARTRRKHLPPAPQPA